MADIHFKSTDNLAHINHQLEQSAAADGKNLKGSDQIRIRDSIVDNGVTIYDASTGKNSLFSQANAAKLFKGNQHLQNALQKHNDKLDNWNVFENAAKNLARDAIQEITEYKITPDQAEVIVGEALDKIRGLKVYKEHDVRFGASKALEKAVTDITSKITATAENPADINAAIKELATGKAPAFENLVYGAPDDLMAVNPGPITSRSSTASAVGPQLGDINSEEYTEIDYGARYSPRSQSPVQGQGPAALQALYNQAIASEANGQEDYNHIFRPLSPQPGTVRQDVHNSDQYGSLNDLSAKENTGVNAAMLSQEQLDAMYATVDKSAKANKQQGPEGNVYDAVDVTAPVNGLNEGAENVYHTLENPEDIYMNNDSTRPPRAYQS